LKPLPRFFYLRPTLRVAQDLLGKYIVHRRSNKLLIGKIVEVEAYRWNDPASHSYRGKTLRNEVMFGEGGHLYVYFTYGMHYCANVVTEKEGYGEAVLIRAVEPLAGIEVMVRNRKKKSSRRVIESLSRRKTKFEESYTPDLLHNLTNGPAKFCEAFGITKSENGLNLTRGGTLITDAPSIPPKLIGRSSRIGIQQGVEKKWRFFIKGNSWISK
jgi:DNA-3-methyladenine glycosylase